MNAIAPSLREGIFSYQFAASPCGGLRTRLMQAEVMLRASGALWLEAERTLVVADLHLEKGSSYAARGQMLPPYDTRETLRRLAAEVIALAPSVVVLLGDTFHDRRSEDRLAADDAERLRELRGAGHWCGWSAITTPMGRAPCPARQPTSLVWPDSPFATNHSRARSPGEIAGHLHPAARVKATRGSVRRRCFITDAERAILPAFGAYAGGLNVRDQAFAGMFARTPMAAALGTARVHAVGWRSLAPD